MTENEAFLRDVLTKYYALDNSELRATSGGSESDRQVVLVYAGEEKYILRAYPPENARSNPAALTQVLNLLSEADYPAERVIPTKDSTPVTMVDGWRFVLTSFIEGMPTDQLDSEFYALGATLGRLHILFTPDELLDRDVPLAERTLDSEMDMARADLLANSRPDTFELAVFYDDLLAAIDTIHRCHDLPYTLIHNDFQPGNVLRTPDGSLSVIDWDGSGRSPAIVDLGYLIGHIHPKGEPKPDAARIHALLDGYLQYGDLSATELERLPDMIRFRPITYLTSDFGNYIANPDNPDPSYLNAIAIYRTADEAAAIVRDYWEVQNGQRVGNPSNEQQIELIYNWLTNDIRSIDQSASRIVRNRAATRGSQPPTTMDGVIETAFQTCSLRMVTFLRQFGAHIRSQDRAQDQQALLGIVRDELRNPLSVMRTGAVIARRIITEAEQPSDYADIEPDIKLVHQLANGLWDHFYTEV